MQEMTLAVVGIDFSNGDGSNRRSGAMMTLPGEPVELVSDPRNKHDSNAIAVMSPRGVQLGYLSAERAPYIGGRMSRGEDVMAIFQGSWRSSAFGSAAILVLFHRRRRRSRRHDRLVLHAGLSHTTRTPSTPTMNGPIGEREAVIDARWLGLKEDLTMTDPDNGTQDDEAEAMEKAQEEAAEEREENGGYQ